MKRSVLIITYALIIFGIVLGCAKSEPVPGKKPEVPGQTAPEKPAVGPEVPGQAAPEKPAVGPAVSGPSLDLLAGSWSGTTQNFSITFNFNKGCQLNAKCGDFYIPEFDLGGDVTFTAVEGDKYFFVVSNLSIEVEGTAYEEWLRVINDNELEYYSSGEYGISTGTLSRK